MYRPLFPSTTRNQNNCTHIIVVPSCIYSNSRHKSWFCFVLLQCSVHNFSEGQDMSVCLLCSWPTFSHVTSVHSQTPEPFCSSVSLQTFLHLQQNFKIDLTDCTREDVSWKQAGASRARGESTFSFGLAVPIEFRQAKLEIIQESTLSWIEKALPATYLGKRPA
jgi:hypothetical protein